MIKFIREIFGIDNYFYYGGMEHDAVSNKISYFYTRIRSSSGYVYRNDAQSLLSNLNDFWLDDTDYLEYVKSIDEDNGDISYTFLSLNLYGYSKLLVQLQGLDARGMSPFGDSTSSALMAILCSMYQVISSLGSKERRKVLDFLECDEVRFSYSGAKAAFEVVRDVVEGRPL